MTKEAFKTTGKLQKMVIIVSICFCVLVFGIVLFMEAKTIQDEHAILESSVESQLIATSIAAREYIDIDDFTSYNSLEDIESDNKDYATTLAQLRRLADSVGAQYIYALKIIDGTCYFIFDTDPINEEVFIEYELSPVHEKAFEGTDAAAIMNVVDEYGSFNTGAVPLYDGNEVVGIIATDITDTFIAESQSAAIRNIVILAVLMVVTLGVMLAMVIILTRRLYGMQKKLEQMAHFDTITGLPNRQYLMEYLKDLTSEKKGDPFALFFIDLDNFKTVNDNAGHDAGDELLRHIAEYLEESTKNAKAFRPAAGRLNIAARIGGDEFIQIVSGVETEEEASRIAEDLLSNFQSKKLDKYIEKYKVGLSVGVALFPYHTEDYNVLIKYADIAMYYAKHSGKNSYRIYQDEMGKEDPDQS